MDPGSAPLTRLVRDDGAFFLDVQAFENNGIIIGQPLRSHSPGNGVSKDTPGCSGTIWSIF
jgi:hypothetical protein